MRTVGVYAALASAAAVAANTVPAASSALFKDFLAEHGKHYEGEEWSLRESIFHANLERMERLRRENPLAQFKVNKFSDLSAEEFKRTYLGGYKPQSDSVTSPAPVRLAPTNVTSVDWRTKGAVTEVYDQGQCGCCWAMSITSTLESAMFLANKGPLTSLSWQQLICCDCTGDDQGCNGGDPELGWKYIAENGVESLEQYPFTDKGPPMPWEEHCNTQEPGKSGRCNLCKYDNSSVVATATGYTKLPEGDESALADAVATVGPVSICIDADSWQTYSGGIMTKCAQDLDHCVQVVGYDKDGATPYWIVKNSWGKSWGDEGYIKIQMGRNLCGIADVATYPVL